MLIREITDVIERFAPLAWQESYDNAGLIVGRPDDEVRKALLAVDVTDEVMAEAEREGCDLIITHHPIVSTRLIPSSGASSGPSAAALRSMPVTPISTARRRG